MKPLVFAGLLCSVALIAPAPAHAAQQIFLVVPGLDGGSADEQFKGAFEALSVTSGMSSAGAVGGGSGAGAGRPTFAPLVVKLRGTPAAGATLEDALTAGRRFPEVVVAVRRLGEAPVVFLTYTLTDVAVTAFEREAASVDDAPAETVALTYGRVRTDQQRQNADGSLGPPVSVCWDVATNARCP
jgi:type VI secretion system secreted protein Hcp